MKTFHFRAVIIGAVLATAGSAVSRAQTTSQVIATVQGQPIYDQDLMSVAGVRLADLRDQEYKVKSDALDVLIRRTLLEAEARKKGLTTEQLLKQEVESKIPEPSDEEAKGYFLATGHHEAMSFETVKPQIKEFIRNEEIQEARKKYEDSLRVQADLTIMLQPPSVQVAYDAARVEGNPEAPVTIVEFGDYQCPFCKRGEATLKVLLAKYNGRVKLAFLDFPLTEIHPNAASAAEAARCAGEQGQYWEYHDSLFADQSKLDTSSLVERAQKLHLNESAFRSCLSSGKFKADIEANRDQGSKAGVSGTPAYFINGVFLNGAQSQAEFEKIIERELTALGGSRGHTATASVAPADRSTASPSTSQSPE